MNGAECYTSCGGVGEYNDVIIPRYQACGTASERERVEIMLGV